MKLVILNVKYSPNLGDGIIAECYEAAVRRQMPGVDVSSCDLAGRTEFGGGLNRSRQLVLDVLDHMPGAVRQLVVTTILKRLIRRSLRGHYAASLKGADVAMIGGGQLLADADLNFPLKIAAAAEEARSAKAELGVFAVGVAAHWTPKAADLFVGALKDKLIYTGVRDAASAERWAAHLGSPPDAIVRDPGLLSLETYGPVEKPQRQRPLIGLGVAYPGTLKLHADESGIGQTDFASFFLDTTRALTEAGNDVMLFTNGAHDDEAYLAKLSKRLEGQPSGAHGAISVAPGPKTPGDLARLIGGFDGMIAHRLHANIIAYSYSVPHVGLGWDSKLPAFFDASGRTGFVVSAGNAGASAVADLIQAAMREGIDTSERNEIAAEAEQDIAGMLKTVVSG